MKTFMQQIEDSEELTAVHDTEVTKPQNPNPDKQITSKTSHFVPDIPAFTTLKFEKGVNNSYWVHLIAQCGVKQGLEIYFSSDFMAPEYIEFIRKLNICTNQILDFVDSISNS
ncbi:hypothetical protein FD975_03610 [Polynucleobacter sp. AP-Jannik-300A-C4]|uniref:hypothetical protein n=1 Tax=Polynucleobacter sp. AP-Jannik-300A-C4 TaxID=2576928 RepID=UPI001BFE9510|nr:hypothetical protein [Polynucleobacter sp. AP-Jannik-300A-C4]QWE23306.1 hypothetical protein FD975_03610 [Polynucleobacter sp. AP-Jannik-300A-C4]